MNIKIIMLVVTLLLLIAEAFTIPFRRIKILGKAGKLKLKIKNKPKLLFISIYVFCAALPFVIVFRNFSILYNIMFCLISVLGMEMTVRDSCTQGAYGVYENAVIANGICVFYDDIVCFPILEFPPEEQEKYDHANLVIATKTKGNVNVIFSSEEECSQATDIIREISGK